MDGGGYIVLLPMARIKRINAHILIPGARIDFYYFYFHSSIWKTPNIGMPNGGCPNGVKHERKTGGNEGVYSASTQKT
jgi:hypothetical protein